MCKIDGSIALIFKKQNQNLKTSYIRKNTMAAKVEIVDLIEHHPITALSDASNIKLLEKVKNTFTEAEQRMFVASFFCYLNHNPTEFIVDFDNVWKWLGFQQKYNGVVVLERHFVEKMDYQVLHLNSQVQKQRGGHNIKKIMLTIRCFKSLCLKAQTKKAAEIHEYYMKLEDIMHEVIKEDGTELRRALEEQKQLLDQKTEELKRTPEQENHNTLLRKYGTINGALIYLVRIQTFENGSYIIKIGESRKGIRNRLTEFKKKYNPNVLILDCFLVQNSVGLEKYLHGHPDIHPAKVTTLPGHEMENELFLIGESLTYQRVLDIIDASLPKFNHLTAEYEQLKTENELLRTQLATVQTTTHPSLSYDSPLLQEILSINRQLLQKVQSLEASHQDIKMRLNAMQTKTTTACSLPDPHLGPRLQKIHPETLQLLHVYESVTECMKEDPTRKRPSINKAAQENTVYRGYRWKLVDRSDDATILHSLSPTKATKAQRNGYVAKVNADETSILAVYLDRKTAARMNGYASIAALDGPVKNHTLKDGVYYELYDECDPVLKNHFISEHGDIVLYHDGIGKFDGSHTLIAEFASRFDCTARDGISQKSLAKVLDNTLAYKEYYYRSLGEKVCIGQRSS